MLCIREILFFYIMAKMLILLVFLIYNSLIYNYIYNYIHNDIFNYSKKTQCMAFKSIFGAS